MNEQAARLSELTAFFKLRDAARASAESPQLSVPRMAPYAGTAGVGGRRAGSARGAHRSAHPGAQRGDDSGGARAARASADERVAEEGPPPAAAGSDWSEF